MMFGIDQAGLAEVLSSVAAAIPQATRAQLLQVRVAPVPTPPRPARCPPPPRLNRADILRAAALGTRALRTCL